MYATDRHTSDRRQTDVRRASSLNASALWGQGHNNKTVELVSNYGINCSFYGRAVTDVSVIKCNSF